MLRTIPFLSTLCFDAQSDPIIIIIIIITVYYSFWREAGIEDPQTNI